MIDAKVMIEPSEIKEIEIEMEFNNMISDQRFEELSARETQLAASIRLAWSEVEKQEAKIKTKFHHCASTLGYTPFETLYQLANEMQGAQHSFELLQKAHHETLKEIENNL